MNEKILSVKNLKKYFTQGRETLHVLENLNLELFKKDIVIIMGESGVGKSTLLSLVGGLDKVTDGEIWFKDINISRLKGDALASIRAEYIGYIFQFHYLLPEFTALENTFLPLWIKHGKYKKEFVNRAAGLLIDVGLGDRLNHKPGELSGGECQRVALARAIINNPELVIADEPTGNLDDKNTRHIFSLMKKLNRKYNTTFLIATHNIEAKKISNKIYTLKNKRLYKYGGKIS